MSNQRTLLRMWAGLCLSAGLAAAMSAPLVAQPADGVVKVISAKGGGMRETAAGIVVGVKDSRAYILAANHIVSDAENVQVVFRNNPRPFRATTLSEYHDDLDLAVVVVEPERDRSLPTNLPGFVLGVVGELEVIDPVLAIGHPRGLDWHVSQSRIAELDHEGDFRKFRLMRSDIQPGNSGGPILDEQDGLIGVVTHITDSSQYAVGVYAAEALKVLKLWQVDTGLLSLPSKLMVASNPWPAEVHLDGERVGSTEDGSLTLHGVLPGRHDVLVVKEGHEPWEEEVTTRRGEAKEVMALLVPVQSQLPVQLDPRVAYVVLWTKAGLRGKSHRILLFDGGTVNFKKGSKWRKKVVSLEFLAPTNVEIVLSEHPANHPKYPGVTARWRGSGGPLTIDKRELKARRILGKISSLRWLVDGRLANDFVYQL